MEWITIDHNLLAAEHKSGKSLRYLARKYRTSKQTIKKKLLASGADIRTSQEQLDLMSAAGELSPAKKVPDPDKLAEICHDKDMVDICRELNVNESRVTAAIESAGIDYKPRSTIKDKIMAIIGSRRQWWDNARVLHDLYVRNLLSTKEIAEAFEVDGETVRCKLAKYGIERRTISEASKLAAARPNDRQRRSETSKQLHADPHYRSKVSAAIRLKWMDQEYRERILSKLHSITISRQQLILYDLLQSLGVEFKPEYIIGPWTFDCFLPDLNILIECQGDYWHSLPDRIKKDERKANYIHKFYERMRLVYFWESAFKQPGLVMTELEAITGKSIKAANFELSDVRIAAVDRDEARALLEKYHYSGTCGNNSVRYGVFLNDQLIGVCSFGQVTRLESIKDLGVDSGQYMELTRLCIKPGYNKHNLVSMLLGKSLRSLRMSNRDLRAIVTFADNTYGHDGTVYRAANFLEAGTSPPSYWYVDIGGWAIHKKTVWDKAKARGLSEEDYAAECGYQRIDGSTKTKFVYFFDKKLKQQFTRDK